ncbi:MAG: hypothetical protein QF481_08815 [Acidimicrobiales bacterium]|nr:hypothetical protein [Acidimicrobiales bacterium]
MQRDRIPVWALRAVWLAQPVTLGPALADGLHDLDGRTFLSVAVWVLWGLGLLATLVPRPATLTAIRIGGPAAAALSVWTATAVDDTTLVVVGLVGAFVLGVLSHWPAVADACVDGASYGDENRFLLRAPGPVVLALGPIAWVLAVAGVVAGPLLLASGDTAVGSAACVAGLPVAAASVRALHHLHRRWIVLVPAGFVLHDHLALADPTLVPRDAIAMVGPAPAGTDAHDLTQAARGLALEVRCREAHDLRPASRDGGAEVIVAEAFLCAPARPDAVLAEAKRRRLPGV